MLKNSQPRRGLSPDFNYARIADPCYCKRPDGLDSDRLGIRHLRWIANSGSDLHREDPIQFPIRVFARSNKEFLEQLAANCDRGFADEVRP